MSIARIQRILAKISTRILACLTLSFYEKQTMTAESLGFTLKGCSIITAWTFFIISIF